MLAIKIDNQEFENRFLEFSKTQKESIENIALQAIKYFMDLEREDQLVYIKKDPLKHIHKIQRDYDEDMCDEVALTHIQDSANYIHDLRREKNR